VRQAGACAGVCVVCKACNACGVMWAVRAHGTQSTVRGPHSTAQTAQQQSHGRGQHSTAKRNSHTVENSNVNKSTAQSSAEAVAHEKLSMPSIDNFVT
jgi:hypothetical protein